MEHPWLDVFFKFAAKCGDEIVYTVMLPLAVWNLNNEFARHFIYLWCLVFYVIHFLKVRCPCLVVLSGCVCVCGGGRACAFLRLRGG